MPTSALRVSLIKGRDKFCSPETPKITVCGCGAGREEW